MKNERKPNNKKQNLKLSPDKANIGKRLDLYLAFAVPELSRSFLKRIIQTEQVKVNGVVEFHPQYRVQAKDQIELEYTPEISDASILPNEEVAFEIVYEDKDILAINKPIGLVVHPAAGHLDDTLANGIKSYLQSKGEDNFGTERAGIVHRLDKETSGLLLVAKSPTALWQLSKLFAEREMKKIYLAAVTINQPGLVPVKLEEGAEFTIDSALGRSKFNRQKFSSNTDKARQATTIFKVLAVAGKSALIAAYPRTGRTHQIRVHLAENGMPIVGDIKYGGAPAGRLMLHAFRLQFEFANSGAATEEIKAFKLSAPPEALFLQTLATLKLSLPKDISNAEVF